MQADSRVYNYSLYAISLSLWKGVPGNNTVLVPVFHLMINNDVKHFCTMLQNIYYEQ